MASDVHARGSVMTSLHVTRRTCTPGLTLLVHLMGLGKLVDIFNGNYLTLIDHFFENIWHSDALSTNTVKFNATG